MWALYVWPLYVSTLYVSTLCVTTLCEASTLTSVLGPDVAEHRKVRELPRKIDFSSWAGCCSTPSTRITTKNRLQFLGRMLQRQKRQKSTSFIVKTPFKSIGEHRKVRELSRKMNIEEVEAPKKYENLQTKPVLDPLKSTADTRKVRELPRKMNIEEVEEPETTKIYRQNPREPVAATRKLREFTDETNIQARNHENSDEIPAPPVRHLDLATPAFYTYRKNPKCYHTVWGKNTTMPRWLPFSVPRGPGFFFILQVVGFSRFLAGKTPGPFNRLIGLVGQIMFFWGYHFQTLKPPFFINILHAKELPDQKSHGMRDQIYDAGKDTQIFFAWKMFLALIASLRKIS